MRSKFIVRWIVWAQQVKANKIWMDTIQDVMKHDIPIFWTSEVNHRFPSLQRWLLKCSITSSFVNDVTCLLVSVYGWLRCLLILLESQQSCMDGNVSGSLLSQWHVVWYGRPTCSFNFYLIGRHVVTLNQRPELAPESTNHAWCNLCCAFRVWKKNTVFFYSFKTSSKVNIGWTSKNIKKIVQKSWNSNSTQ